MARYWLMKSEPDVYPFSQLVADGSTHWDGVRNYQARNMMRDDLKLGDMVLFYHSNTKPPHVAGIARVSREGYPDHTSWDPESKYFDAKSSPDNPRWVMVEIEAIREMNPVSLVDVKANPVLDDMPLVQRGQRLSVQPVSKGQYEEICRMGGVE
ncbi:MAG: EVE domain-containing protein [Euryarchaeota archaeon]|nr:EVE domain-containing protein [Euryarchaeota archaeon]MBT4981509.1 EVE domain-containing protein [Euryarchaeota archaeon]MBT5183578.1 EVE domain-containing protein [Euryarchaeota archaeon]